MNFDIKVNSREANVEIIITDGSPAIQWKLGSSPAHESRERAHHVFWSQRCECGGVATCMQKRIAMCANAPSIEFQPLVPVLSSTRPMRLNNQRTWLVMKSKIAQGARFMAF